MTNAFVAGIAATLASETAAGNIPVPPFKVTYSPDYGSDISCTSDTDAMFTEIAGDDPVRELYAPHPPGFRFV